VSADTALQLDAFVTPGTLLKAAREGEELSTREVAERLNWTPGYVEIIERDDYQALLSPAFARGYVKAYGRLLAMDEQQLLATFDQYRDSRQDMAPRRVQTRPLQMQHTGLGVVVGLAVLGILVFVLWWWQVGSAAAPAALEQDAQGTVDAGIPGQSEGDRVVAGGE
jgi:cytoskeleton protein RodZ